MSRLQKACCMSLCGLGLAISAPLWAQASAGGNATRGGAQVENAWSHGAKAEQVVAGGQVPDEATRVAVITALREVYGSLNVVDKIEVVGTVQAPANWSANVQKLLTPSLKQIRKGQLQIEGTQMVVQGEVESEPVRQKVMTDMAGALNPTYTIKNSLRVPASEQHLIDQQLGQRTIEFEVGSATLTNKGRLLLDELAPSLSKLTHKSFAIVGHTDNLGNHASNVALSKARADTVKGYLVGKGIDPATMSTSGVGPDQPVTSNDTDAGRARNRRIEFRVSRGAT